MAACNEKKPCGEERNGNQKFRGQDYRLMRLARAGTRLGLGLGLGLGIYWLGGLDSPFLITEIGSVHFMICFILQRWRGCVWLGLSDSRPTYLLPPTPFFSSPPAQLLLFILTFFLQLSPILNLQTNK